jgi:hypothetical protein
MVQIASVAPRRLESHYGFGIRYFDAEASSLWFGPRVRPALAGTLFFSPPVEPAVDWLRVLPILVAPPPHFTFSCLGCRRHDDGFMP